MREWGGRGSLRYDRGGDDIGLTVAISPSWGATGSRANQLWRDAVPFRSFANSSGTSSAARLDSEVGYGFTAFNGNGTITPYGGFSMSAGHRDWRLGSRFDVSPSLGIRVEGARREQQNAAPDHRIRLSLHTAW